jgi:hypothetical protein
MGIERGVGVLPRRAHGDSRRARDAANDCVSHAGVQLPVRSWAQPRATQTPTLSSAERRPLCGYEYGNTLYSMAIPKIKATYSLDAETVRLLERLARQWDVSKSEALRRAIRASAAEPRANAATAALDRLQQSLGMTEAVAAGWARHARAERRASAKRRGT